MPAKAATKTAEPKVSSLDDFKKKSGRVTTLPSGLTIKLRSPGMTTFLQSGMVPNSLMATITEAINKGKSPDITDVDLEDNEQVQEMLGMIDAVTCRCAVQPRVYPLPTDETDRDPDLLYVDELEEYDKLFIFQWATGGTSDVDRFREELDEHVGNLSDGEDVPDKPKRAPRAKKRP